MRVRIPAVTGLLMLAMLAACSPDEDADDVIADVGDGKADATALSQSLRLSEVLITARSGHQYVEVVNTSDQPIDLTRVLFATHTRRRTAFQPVPDHPSVVPPGSLALLGDSPEAIARGPGWLPAVVASSGKLGSRIGLSEVLRLFVDGRLVDQSRVASGPMSDVSLERTQPGAATWVPSPRGQTPGLRNAGSTADAIHMVFDNPPRSPGFPCRDELLRFIAATRQTLDVAVYQANDAMVFDALIEAAGRGVKVRVVTDTEYFVHPLYKPQYDRLAAANIPVVDDQRTALMHSKFIIADSARVWTGSFNFLIERNPPKADNAVWFVSSEMARAFSEQFEQLFARKFGPAKQPSTRTEFYVDGARVEAYFAPKDPTLRRIPEVIGAARQSVTFAAFSFYSDALSGALTERTRAGLDVRGVFDARSSGGTLTEYGALAQAGVDVRVPGYSLFLHDKFLVVDENGADPVVVTGSYNFSDKAANANDESLIMVHDPVIARGYGETFRHVFLRSTGPNQDSTAPILRIDRVLTSAPSEAQRIEITNMGTAPADLATVRLTDGSPAMPLVARTGRDPGIVLGPGERAWIVDNSFAPTDSAGALMVTTATGQLGDGLSALDGLLLLGGRAALLDSFSYPLPTPEGHPISRAGALDLAASWQAE